MTIVLFFAVLFLAFANGANDNFKGVATLWSSGVLNYKQALILANIATFFGALTAYFFAATLLKNFSGKGIVPNEVAQSLPFVLSIALGAGLTIILATQLGFPISTTHSIVGGLTGVGLIAVGSQVNFATLGKNFFLPLILSPILATTISIIIYSISKKMPTFSNKIVNKFHIFSAGVVCFSHGLNDAPKIIALILLSHFFDTPLYFLLVAVCMFIGSILYTKKVATTMSKKIAILTTQKGLAANSVTGMLVIIATSFGLPVSFTHISVGAIYGVGLLDKTANGKEVSKIVMSWVLTLPIAAIISATGYYFFKNIN
jgi:inorganic phosphate transporter, PiT family